MRGATLPASKKSSAGDAQGDNFSDEIACCVAKCMPRTRPFAANLGHYHDPLLRFPP